MTLPQQESNTVTNQEGQEVEVPSKFLCPITLQLMVRPLMTRNGLNFERHAILDWLREGPGNCPLTRKPLTASDLISDKHLEMRITFWRQRNKIVVEEEDEENVDVASTKFVGFLKLSPDMRDDLVARHSLAHPTMSLASLSTSVTISSIGPNSSSVEPQSSPTRSPRSPLRRLRRLGDDGSPTGSPRRNFLARILAAAGDLDDL